MTIEELKAENARLKAEVERLTRKLEVADNHAQCLEMVINAGTAKELRLKAEVERLEEGNDCLDKMHDKEMERSAYLLEEFNRTTAWGRGLESDLSHARVEISFLKAEVERLTTLCKQVMAQHSDISCENIMLRKAGDAMAADLPPFGSVKDWNAAKEGKPSV